MSTKPTNIAGRTGLRGRVIRAGVEQSWEPGAPKKDPGWKSGKSIPKICLCGLLSLFAAVQPALAQSTLSAWGDNTYRQLGNSTSLYYNTPVPVAGLTGVKAFAGGYRHSLVLKSDGTVWAWGGNERGQLGNGTNTGSAALVPVTGLTGVTAIATTDLHNLALKTDGTVWAWGNNDAGQLGNGTNTESNVPVQVNGLTAVMALVAGADHSIALKTDGTVWAWGGNQYVQLGNGTIIGANTPGPVSGLTGVTAVAGAAFHSLALKSDGTVWAWGFNLRGESGNGTYATTAPFGSSTPGAVTGLVGVKAISAGTYHSLALKNDQTVWAWGHNQYGQLGDGTNTSINIPLQVPGLSAVAIAGGGHHSLVLLSDGTVRAWGYNGPGELGNCTYTDSSTPVVVRGLTGVTAIGEGATHSLALGNPPSIGACNIDSTPPLIVPTVTGTLGTNGWYTSNVTVSWSVSDPETGIASSTGCGLTILTTDTPGTLTCSATNGAGLSSSLPVTVKIDQTPAVITPTVTGQLGSNGWYTGPVTVSWNVTDAQSGITSSSGCAQTTLTADTPGNTLTCSAINGAGLSSSVPLTIKIDTSRPVISGMPGAGCSLWPPNHKMVQVATVTA